MSDRRRSEDSKWVRDIIVSGILVPALLAYLNEPPAVVVIGGFVCLAILKAWEYLPIKKSPIRRKKMLAFSGMLLFGACFVASAIWYFAIRDTRPANPKDIQVAPGESLASAPPPAPIAAAPKPVAPSPSENPIAWSFEQPGNSPDGIFCYNDHPVTNEMLVCGFEMQGTNISPDPITRLSAYVEPLNTGDTLTMKIRGEKDILFDTAGMMIEPKAEFALFHIIPRPNDPAIKQGINVSGYLREYGGFTFHLEYNGGKVYEHTFLYSEVQSILENREQKLQKERVPRPGVKQVRPN